ncbi:uncharacterized protein LOC121410848 [Lytechinus variegatus]|uniref:uncharacterized protein LOC121410848 n=1 Tax=Lytechinus variegatus TaxID=7654 RepID=UPI001BB101CD|nr:uncharacterized protein LOC121410848 [Lytechinus variegatus]
MLRTYQCMRNGLAGAEVGEVICPIESIASDPTIIHIRCNIDSKDCNDLYISLYSLIHFRFRKTYWESHWTAGEQQKKRQLQQENHAYSQELEDAAKPIPIHSSYTSEHVIFKSGGEAVI